MKYAVICKQDDGMKWISAISSNEHEILKYVDKIPQRLKVEIRKIDIKEYPLYIIEDDLDKPFIFSINTEGIIKKMKSTKRNTEFDEYESYFVVYKVTEDFLNLPASVDLMGRLRHYHITNFELENPTILVSQIQN